MFLRSYFYNRTLYQTDERAFSSCKHNAVLDMVRTCEFDGIKVTSEFCPVQVYKLDLYNMSQMARLNTQQMGT